MAYKLVIFDLDGTLVDSVRDVADCFDAALQECGFPARGVDAVGRLVGQPLEQIVRQLLPASATDGDVSVVSQAYRRVYAASPKPNTKPYPGMLDLLHTLVGKGVKIAVNSNKPHENAVRVMESLYPGIPMRISGYGDVSTTKPAPEGARLLMREAGVLPNETVYVGDTKVDLDTANNAGIDCILVTWGQGNNDALLEHRTTPTVSSSKELKIVLECKNVSDGGIS